MKTGVKVAIVLLIIALIGCLGYITYDKVYLPSTKKEEAPVKEELDANSTLVQELYNTVVDRDGYKKYWMYERQTDTSITTPDEFLVKDLTEEEKMKFVGLNLNERKTVYLNCDNTIANELDGRYSVCYYENISHQGLSQQAYTKEYVNNVYTKIFGTNSKLDTNAKIQINAYAIDNYYYNEQLDKYVEYVIDGGGTSAATYTGVVDKAIKDNNKVTIYEKSTYTDHSKLDESGKEFVEESTYIYTFEQDNDGNYVFVGRVKEVDKNTTAKPIEEPSAE